MDNTELEKLSLRQKQHYENIHTDYELHYYDTSSMAYRKRFIFNPLFRGIDLNHKKVADFACGSGHNSLMILQQFPTADVVGYDISAKACAAYRELVQKPAFEIDLTAGALGDGSFDAAIIVGGLHHCISDLNATLATIASFLKPGGTLFIFEPSSDFFLQSARALWYKADKYFDELTEEALSHKRLSKMAEKQFKVTKVKYMGGPGYFIILNSLLFRIPLSWKRFLAPPLMLLDTFYNFLTMKYFFPYFIARWEKR